MAGQLEEKSIDDVCQWLEDGRFPDSILQTFRGTSGYAVSTQSILSVICLNTEQDMDCKAIAFGLATAPGPDWLKDVIPALGLMLAYLTT